MTWELPPTLCDPMVVEGGGGLQESWQSLCLIRLLGGLGGGGGGVNVFMQKQLGVLAKKKKKFVGMGEMLEDEG